MSQRDRAEHVCSSTKKTHGYAETITKRQCSLLESSELPTLNLNKSRHVAGNNLDRCQSHFRFFQT